MTQAVQERRRRGGEGNEGSACVTPKCVRSARLQYDLDLRGRSGPTSRALAARRRSEREAAMKRNLLAVALATLPWSVVNGQAPSIGQPAPSFELEAWTNLATGEKEPTPNSLHGSVVLLEFWGTWCAPCVRAMPRIQALHDRLKDQGLKVLGISYEPVNVIEPFAKSNGYTFALGSDPAKRVVEAYGVASWPTSIVIGKDGKIAHVGSPYDVEPAIEKALGLETSPAALLTAALDALASKDRKSI